MVASSPAPSSRLRVPRRFRGPSDSGNGGYSCGTFASAIEGPAQVTLRRPVPLDRELIVNDRADGTTEIRDQDELIAEAQPAAALEGLEPPARPSPEEAQRHSERSLFRSDEHPYPECFVCGPAHEDGLGLFAGPVDGDTSVCAAALQPRPSLPSDGERLDPRIVWAALDCPSCTQSIFEAEEPFLLGRLSAELIEPVPAAEPTVVVGWEIGREGRKVHSACAVLSADGELLARSRALWILLRRG